MKMDKLESKNATIESVSIEIEEGYLTAWIYLKWQGAGQGFGGYSLYLSKDFTHHKVQSSFGHFIYRVLEVAGVDAWNKLVGRTVRFRGDHKKIETIGHITSDDWFNPAKDFGWEKER